MFHLIFLIMKILEMKTTAVGLTKLLLNSEPFIWQKANGKITVEMDVQLLNTTSQDFKIVVCEYTGSLNLNSGVHKNTDFPVQLTEGGCKVWESFVNDCAEKLIDFVKNN